MMIKKKTGFTLSEVLIAMTLVSIVTVVTLPNIVGWVSGYRLTSIAQQIAMEMRLARGKAVSESKNINFIVIPGRGCNASYQIVPDGPVRSVSQSITIGAVAGDNPLVFNSRGQASDDTTVLVRNKKREIRAIHVNVAGRVEITTHFGSDEFEGSFDES